MWKFDGWWRHRADDWRWAAYAAPDDVMHSIQQILDRFEAVCLNWNLGMRVISPDGKLLGGANTCALCERCSARRNCRDALYAGNISAQLGISYIHRCMLGGVLFSGTLVEGDSVRAHIVLGPSRMWEWDDYAREELHENCAQHPELVRDMTMSQAEAAFSALPELNCKQARDICQLLFDICAAISCEENYLSRQRDTYNQQAELFGVVESEKSNATPGGYPLNIEQELLRRVRVGDRQGARAILNELLGHILYDTGCNIEIMKARSLELVVMISRAAVEGGAELNRLLGMNYNFISELSGFEAFDEICLWLIKVLDKFMDTVYSTRATPNMLLLRGAVSFIRENYTRNIVLDEVAASVHISPYYLSHLFREELGITFIEYLTRTRVERAKQLLSAGGMSVSDVAREVGYDDAGYFSRVFKKLTGRTPAAYRKP